VNRGPALDALQIDGAPVGSMATGLG